VANTNNLTYYDKATIIVVNGFIIQTSQQQVERVRQRKIDRGTKRQRATITASERDKDRDRQGEEEARRQRDKWEIERQGRLIDMENVRQVVARTVPSVS
jgi:ribosomal protein S10